METQSAGAVQNQLQAKARGKSHAFAHTDAKAETRSRTQPIGEDAKWAAGKMMGGAKALGGWLKSGASKVGGAIDAAYDKTKAGIKGAAKAAMAAPGNIKQGIKDWKEKHNFAQAHSGVKQANAAL